MSKSLRDAPHFQEQVRTLVQQGLLLREIVQQVGVFQTTVSRCMRDMGVKIERRGPKPGRLNRACRHCGETSIEKFLRRGDGHTSSLCRECHAKRSAYRYRHRKMEALAYKGGKCEECGYSKCAGSLHFHHRDPTQKDPEWNKLRALPLEKIKSELDKCVLLCANCHGEHHWDKMVFEEAVLSELLPKLRPGRPPKNLNPTLK